MPIAETAAAVAAAVGGAVAALAEAGAVAPGSPVDEMQRVQAEASAIAARDPFQPPAVLEGDHAGAAGPSAPAAGEEFAPGSSAPTPVTGDRPPPSAVYGTPLTTDAEVISYDDPLVIEVAATPVPEPGSEASGPAPQSAPEPPSTTVPASGEPPAAAPGVPARTVIAAPLAPPPGVPPPAGEAETPGPEPAPEPDRLGRVGIFPVTADLADYWEKRVTFTNSALIFGASGEEVSAAAKKAIEDALSDLGAKDEHTQSQTARIASAIADGATKTLTDIVIDFYVVPLLDPGTLVRGFMRLGAGAPEGLRKVEQGKGLEGGAIVVGEAAAVLLVVVAPIAAGRKGAAPKAGEPQITVHRGKGGGGLREWMEAHVVVELKWGDVVKRFDAMRDLSADLQVVTSKAKSILAKDWELWQDLGTYPKSVTRGITIEQFQRALARAEQLLKADPKGYGAGHLGPFSWLGENCSTFVADIASKAGMTTTGKFGPRITSFLAQYAEPLNMLLMLPAGPAANASAGSAEPRASSAP